MKRYILFLLLIVTINTKSQVVINEIMVMPGSNYVGMPGGDNTNASIQAMFYYSNGVYGGSEWIELYNSDPCMSVDIGCWMISSNSGPGSTAEGAFIFPEGTVIPPLGFLTIGGATAGPMTITIDNANLINNYTCDGSGSTIRWHLYNGRGYLTLYDNNLNIVDAIYWALNANELNTHTEFDNDGGCIPWVQSCNHDPMFYAPMAKNIPNIQYIGDCSSSQVGNQFIGKSAGRTVDGGSSWTVGMNPTPGSANCPTCPAAPGSFSLNIVATNPSCGQNNGSIIISQPAAGTPPYSYSINGGSSFQNNGNFENLSDGQYVVVVQDDMGCSADSIINLQASAGFNISVTSTNETCGNQNASITVTVSPNISNLQFSNNGGSSFQSSGTFNNLSAGIFNLVIVDNDGCQQDTTVTITNLPGPDITTAVIDASCGNANGSVTLIVSGGEPPYNYSWSNGSSGASVNNIAPGNYLVTVTDATGCQSTTQITVNNIGGPVATINSTDASCSQQNGTATVIANGGSGSYSYSWNTNPPQYTQTASHLGAGTYTCTVSDGGPCPVVLSVTILQTLAPELSVTSVSASCNFNNGTAMATATGGSGNYSYVWSTVPQQNTASAINLSQGNYIVTVSDGNCQVQANVIVGHIPPPTISLSTQDAHCGQSNGSATVIASGGSGNYTYLWSTNPPQNTSVATQLTQGVYGVTVSDANCEASGLVSIWDIPGPDASFYYMPRKLDIYNPTATFYNDSQGAVSSSQWTFGDGSYSNIHDPVHTFPGAGEYEVILTVSDNYGCSDTAVQVIIVSEVLEFFMPNAFTPDGDGKNDVFGPKGIYISPDDYSFAIFNRWGEIIFYTNDIELHWDGTSKSGNELAPQGTYVYHVNYSSVSGKKHSKIGNVTLLR